MLVGRGARLLRSRSSLPFTAPRASLFRHEMAAPACQMARHYSDTAVPHREVEGGLKEEHRSLLERNGVSWEKEAPGIERSWKQAQMRAEKSFLKSELIEMQAISYSVDPNVAFWADTLNPNFRLGFRTPNSRDAVRLRYRSKIFSKGVKAECSLRCGFHLLFGSNNVRYTSIPAVMEVGEGWEIALMLTSVSWYSLPGEPGRTMVSLNDVMGVGFGVSRIKGGVMYLDHEQGRLTEKLREMSLMNNFVTQWSAGVSILIAVIFIFSQMKNVKQMESATEYYERLNVSEDGELETYEEWKKRTGR